jgi:acyl carrier protein
MARLIQILQTIRPEMVFSESQNFIDDGLLDSFDLVTLVATLDKEFGISIPGTDIVPENFQNLDTIAALLKKLGRDL